MGMRRGASDTILRAIATASSSSRGRSPQSASQKSFSTTSKAIPSAGQSSLLWSACRLLLRQSGNAFPCADRSDLNVPFRLRCALEEFGYLAMPLSFVLVASAFDTGGRLAAGVRWIFRAAFGVAVVGLAAYWVTFGIDRKDRFEVVILSACWIALIANGVLLAVYSRGRLKTSQAG
jgi:hypothetical protein